MHRVITADLMITWQCIFLNCTSSSWKLTVTNLIDPEIESLLEALGVRKPEKILNN
jgi:hypothetical protein